MITQDLQTSLSNLNERLWEIVKSDCFIAGGFVRDAVIGLDFSDVDVFFRTEEAMLEFKDIMYTKHDTDHRVVIADHCVILSEAYPVEKAKINKYTVDRFERETDCLEFQFVTKSFGSEMSVLSNFDSTINMLAYDISSGDMLFDHTTYPASIMNADQPTSIGCVEQINCELYDKMLNVSSSVHTLKDGGTFFGKANCKEDSPEATDKITQACKVVVRTLNLQRRFRLGDPHIEIMPDVNGISSLLMSIVDYAHDMGKKDVDLNLNTILSKLNSDGEY
jgi:hypothetical protein